VSKEEQQSSFKRPKKSYGIEFSVGLFSLICLVCFGYLAVNLAGMKLLNTGYYDVYAEFDNVSGLEPGASVELAGVPIGSVEQIALAGTAARITMKIRDGITLRDDDVASIRTKGIIGERYIKVTPGGSEMMVDQGEELMDTESAMEFEEVIGKFIHSLE